MTKTPMLVDFQQNLIDNIKDGHLVNISTLKLGSVRFVLLNINSPLELKRFAHIFAQCDLDNLVHTCSLLSRAGFIKDIRFSYLTSLNLYQNLCCFVHVQKARLFAHLGI